MPSRGSTRFVVCRTVRRAVPSVAPGVFQITLDTILAGILQVAVYLDNILVASESVPEHKRALTEVLSRLSRTGLLAQEGKCEFFIGSTLMASTHR